MNEIRLNDYCRSLAHQARVIVALIEKTKDQQLIAQCLHYFNQGASGLDQEAGKAELDTVHLVWAWADSLTVAATCLCGIELPEIDDLERLRQLATTEMPLGIVFDDHEKAKAKTELINYQRNWKGLFQTRQCKCKRYYCAMIPSSCAYCQPCEWLELAKTKCAETSDPAATEAALMKGWEIIVDCGAQEPNVWVHDQECEFKWPGAALYTLPLKEPIYLLQKHEFVSVSYEEFKVKFSG